MNVLYISHMAEQSGWGAAARDYILALDSVGINVTCRALKLGTPTPELPQRILELEQTKYDHYDVCIQHVLPHHLAYSGNFKKNICLYTTETSNFKKSGWQHYINMMDYAIVPCSDSRGSSLVSGVNIPITVVPHAFDINRKMPEYEELNIDKNGDFLFYFVGEFNQRKNIPALLRAFHTEFHPAEPVNLFIKTNSSSFSPDALFNQVVNLANKIKEDLRLHPTIGEYKQELISTDYITNEQLMLLHMNCDCMVHPSYGEAWGIPQFDAMTLGKYPICTDVGGMAKYIVSGKTGELIASTQGPVFGVKDTFDNLFTGNEDWAYIDIPLLRKAMRKVYNNRGNKEFWDNVKLQSQIKMKEFSYESVGEIFKKKLEFICRD